MGLACLNYSRQDTHTKVHIARSTATNRGEGALHLGAEVSMHCAISMWIPPLHRRHNGAHAQGAEAATPPPPWGPLQPAGGRGVGARTLLWQRRCEQKAQKSTTPKAAMHVQNEHQATSESDSAWPETPPATPHDPGAPGISPPRPRGPWCCIYATPVCKGYGDPMHARRRYTQV